jgi:hypothetical protein
MLNQVHHRPNGFQWLGLGTGTGLFIALHWLPNLGPVWGTWFYPLVWWSFIGLVEWVHVLRGRGVFVGSDVSFFRVAGFSTVLWFVFEAYNLYLGNWYYVGVPAERTLRWFGTAVSFATVLPGMWVVQRAVDDLFGDRFSGFPGVPVSDVIRTFLLVFGVVCSVGPFLYPDVFFPFVWGGLLFVADWVGARIGGRSYMEQVTRGNYRPLFTWMLAGAVCGFLWEFWNFQATAGWIYTVPGMGEWRLFEMPLLGYLGFPPFALMARRLHTLWEDLRQRNGLPSPRVTAVLAVVFCVMTLVAMDGYTYVSTRIEPNQFVGWTPSERRALRGHHTLDGARRVLKGAEARRKIRLLGFARLGTELGNCLWRHDVRSVEAIRREPTDSLARVLQACEGGPLRFWTRRVRDWKQRA